MKQTTRQRKRTEWMTKALRWRRVGTEEMFGLDLLTTRVKRKPPAWRLSKVGEDGSLFYYALRKMKKRPNWMRSTPCPGWELVGPEGYVGVHTQHNTKMGALRLCADLDESKMEREADE